MSPKAAAAFTKLQGTSLTSPDYRSTLHAAVDATSTDLSAPHIWLFSYPRLLAEASTVKDIPDDYVTQRFEGTRVTSG